MALLIIKAGEGSEDPTGFQKYDVVEVMEDGSDPGSAVCLPDFLIIQVDGVKADYEWMKDPVYNDDAEFEPALDADGNQLKDADGNDIMDVIKPPTLAAVRDAKFDFDSELSTEQMTSIKSSEAIKLISFPVESVLIKGVAEQVRMTALAKVSKIKMM